MKIAVVGCGAVGSFYGGKLAHAGHDVHFLLRSDYSAVSERGVLIRSPEGDIQVRPRCARSPEEIGVSDLVLIGLKTTANNQFGRLLPPLVGPATGVLTLQNGLGNEEALARLFRPQQVMGGLCFVCVNRLAPGLIHHIDHGQVVLGEFQRPPEPRTRQIAGLFKQAGVGCNVTNDLARTHWEKLVWNIPFNGLGVAAAAGFEALAGGRLPIAESPPTPGSVLLSPHEVGQPNRGTLTTDKLLAEARWMGLLRDLMFEVIATARALGFDVADSLADTLIRRTRTMGAYKASTLLDFERGQPLELESLFLEPLRQAQRARVPIPRLEALCRILQRLDPARSP
jgi:2-dehydropantoate 2-reductase